MAAQLLAAAAQATGLLARLGGRRVLVPLLVFAAVLIVGLAIVALIWYRRRRRPAVVIRRLSPGRLWQIWREFRRPLTSEVRRALREYPWVVVMGEAGVGKSMIIDVLADWQGQQRQFLPSYNKDPLMQVYLGAKVLVQ